MLSTLRLADCGNDGRSTSVTVTCLERDGFDPGRWLLNVQQGLYKYSYPASHRAVSETEQQYPTTPEIKREITSKNVGGPDFMICCT